VVGDGPSIKQVDHLSGVRHRRRGVPLIQRVAVCWTS